MANRVVPTALDADNSSGSCTLAACNDWRSAVRRFHVGTGLYPPTSDEGYTTAGLPSGHNYRSVSCYSGGVHVGRVTRHVALHCLATGDWKTDHFPSLNRYSAEET